MLLAVALAYGAAGTALYHRDRDTASLLWAIGLTLAAIGAASLASGATLTIVWSAEAAILAWLAQRIKEPRFQLAAFAWLTLAFAHGIAIDAPPSKLFVENTESLGAGRAPRPWRRSRTRRVLALRLGGPRRGLLDALFVDLRGSQPWIRRGGYALAGITALYAGSLALVGLPSSWDWGHVLVAALWSFVAVLLVFTRLRAWGLALLAATVALVVVYDVPFIAEVRAVVVVRDRGCRRVRVRARLGAQLRRSDRVARRRRR